MGLKCGIIGLPNVGKSTLFNALTKSHIAAANFPFCTIEPNIGMLSVPDDRLNQIASIVKPKRIVPTTIEFVDTAGLVKNASQGEGLGNQFLTKIREVEVIAHVVRCFEDETIIHINGNIDPKSDINIINTELILADIDLCEKAIIRVQKRIKSNDQNAQLELVLLKKCLKFLSNFGMLRHLNLSNEEKSAIRYLSFITLKPTMYIANINNYSSNYNYYLDQVRFLASNEKTIFIIVCATIESELAEHMKLGIQEPEYGLNNVIKAGYKLLNLQTYFTAGHKEVRAWTIPVGTTALQAANKIHTDFAKGFIRAQTISFNDFITFKGEKGAKKAGKIHLEGREYIVKDGDVINFLFNV